MIKFCVTKKQKMFIALLVWVTISMTINLAAAEDRDVGRRLPMPASVACQIQLGDYRSDQTDIHEVVSFPTFDVKNASLPFEIREQIGRAIELSFTESQFQEVGFYVFVLKTGEFVPGEVYSSGSSTSLAMTDGDSSFDLLMKRTQGQEIVRIEHFHTHPDLGPSALSLSSGDITAVLSSQKRLRNRGIDVPFAENVIHTFNRWGTEVGNVRRVEIDPTQVRTSRSDIAADLIAKRKKQELSFTLPSRTDQYPIRGENLKFILEGNVARRTTISDALKWAYQVEFTSRRGDRILRERQAHLMKLPFLNRVYEDTLPKHANGKAWAVAAALGLQGEVSNSLKILVDIKLQDLLQTSSLLSFPEPNALVVYRSEGVVKALSVYRGPGADGNLRVASRLDMVGDIAFEHDWDDVPLEWGTTVEFYRLPSMGVISQLFNIE